jgi:neutral trehalase
MPGLSESGRRDLAGGMVDNFAALVGPTACCAP